LLNLFCVVFNPEQLGDQLTPIQQKIKKKEAERDRLRSHSSDETERLSKALNDFCSEVKNLHNLTREIDEYAASDESGRLEEVEKQLATAAKRIGERKKDLGEMQSELDKVKNLVKDQERRKKDLQNNIQILAGMEDIKKTEKEIKEKDEEFNSIPGANAVDEQCEKLSKKKSKLVERKAQTDGRRSEVVERLRSLKVSILLFIRSYGLGSCNISPVIIDDWQCSGNCRRQSTRTSTGSTKLP